MMLLVHVLLSVGQPALPEGSDGTNQCGESNLLEC